MSSTPPHWCDICGLDLQSSKSLQVHQEGRKHRNRLREKGIALLDAIRPSASWQNLDQDAFFENLAKGAYRNIVVLTGAGVSTSAGIPDFRSPGNVFDSLRSKFSDRFPAFLDEPEFFLSGGFKRRHPEIWRNEVWPLVHENMMEGHEPTLTHKFVAWLDRKGWLRRVYTQNVDGLHSHPSLKVAEKGVIVECHGSLAAERDPIVLYGDQLPGRFFGACRQDFGQRNNNNKESTVDLMLVMGTALQVAPVCAVPNLAPKGCARVLVNRDLQDCFINQFSVSSAMMPTRPATKLGGRSVSLRPLWRDRKANRKWRQLLIESDCDEFVRDFFEFAEKSGILDLTATTS